MNVETLSSLHYLCDLSANGLAFIWSCASLTTTQSTLQHFSHSPIHTNIHTLMPEPWWMFLRSAIHTSMKRSLGATQGSVSGPIEQTTSQLVDDLLDILSRSGSIARLKMPSIYFLLPIRTKVPSHRLCPVICCGSVTLTQMSDSLSLHIQLIWQLKHSCFFKKKVFWDLYIFFKAPSCRIVSRVGRRPRAPVFVELGMRLNNQLQNRSF